MMKYIKYRERLKIIQGGQNTTSVTTLAILKQWASESPETKAEEILAILQERERIDGIDYSEMLRSFEASIERDLKNPNLSPVIQRFYSAIKAEGRKPSPLELLDYMTMLVAIDLERDAEKNNNTN